MTDKVSPFWLGVEGHPCHVAPFRTKSQTLDAAVKRAVATKNIGAAFRHCREVADFTGRFRRFFHDDIIWICKITRYASAECEYANARQAQERLDGLILYEGMPVRVVIPFLVELDSGEAALISPYHGSTLHNMGDEAKRVFDRDLMMDLFKNLLKRGVLWKGFAPRNVIVDTETSRPPCVKLIDWESTRFFPPCPPPAVDDLLLLFIRLNWAMLYGDVEPELKRLTIELDHPIVSAPLDGFERCFKHLYREAEHDTTVRKVCSRITIMSEWPLDYGQSRIFSPFEAGHIVDEFLPQSLSVVYTAASARVREERGDDYLAYALDCLAKLLQCRVARSNGQGIIPADPADISRDLLFYLLLFSSGDAFKLSGRLKSVHTISGVYEAFRTEGGPATKGGLDLLSLSGVGGWDAAIRRSNALDHVLRELFRLARGAIDMNENLDLLLRGSAAHGLVTSRSDLDFEVSGPDYTAGHPAWESLVKEAVLLFGIDSEGSEGRPTCTDLVSCSNGRLTRDLHEWMELRRPGAPAHDPGWLASCFHVTPEQLQQTSQYEAAGFPLTPKTLFFETRALVARTGFRFGLEFARIDVQLSHIGYKFQSLGQRLRNVVRMSLDLYERDIRDRESQLLTELQAELDSLRFELSTPRFNISCRPLTD